MVRRTRRMREVLAHSSSPRKGADGPAGVIARNHYLARLVELIDFPRCRGIC